MELTSPEGLLVLILGLGFGPGFYWMSYFYKKDWLEPEPKLLVIRAFVIGMLLTLPAGILNHIWGLSPFVTAVGIAPVVEETLKFLGVLIFFYPRKEFNEPMDGIVYAAAVALGFASVENVLYLKMAFESGDSGWAVALIRALLSVPGHALFTIFGGFALGLRKCPELTARRGSVLLSLTGAMILHSLFNLIAHFPGITWVGVLIGVAFLGIFVWGIWQMVKHRISFSHHVSPFRTDRYWRRRSGSL